MCRKKREIPYTKPKERREREREREKERDNALVQRGRRREGGGEKPVTEEVNTRR